MNVRGLTALLLLFIFLATTYNIAVPLGEGPDEPGHFDYVLFLARERRLPLQGTDENTQDVPSEGHQPPLAYLLMLPAVMWLPHDQHQPHRAANPHFLWHDGTEPAAFMRTSNEYLPWRGHTLAWHLARGVSVLLSVLTLCCVWLAARTFEHLPPTFPLLATALVALNPQFLFTSALVTNDTLLITLSAALLALCLAWKPTVAPHTHYRYAAGAGLLLGAALITKQHAILLIFLPCWALWRISMAQALSRSAIFSLITITIVTTMALAGWWYVRNWQLYGDPLALTTFRATFLTEPFPWESAAAWSEALQRLHTSFWAYFGWVSLPPPSGLMLLYSAIELLALGALIYRCYARPPWRNCIHASPWLLIVVLCMLTFAWVLSFATIAGMVAWQGRLLFIALPAIGLLLARGLITLLPSPRATMIFSAPLLLIALLVPWLWIAPAYPWHTLPPHRALIPTHTPTYARFAKPWQQGSELRAWAATTDESPIPVQTLQAGDSVTITLTWHALEPIEHNWTVFLHLVDEDGEIVAEHNSIPQHGAFPMPLWSPGDWLHDTHPLTIPSTLAPGHYALRVGLYLPWQRDPRRGRRQQVWNAEREHIGDYVTIGRVIIRT